MNHGELIRPGEGGNGDDVPNHRSLYQHVWKGKGKRGRREREGRKKLYDGLGDAFRRSLVLHAKKNFSS